MRVPTPAQLLQAWERGCDQPVAARVLLLLAAAHDGAEVDVLATLSLGQRDALLLELHARLFGGEIVGLADCPHCNAEVEAVFECADLLAADPAGTGRSLPASPAIHALQADGIELRFRLPDSNDLLAIEHCRDPEIARETLLARCVIDAARDGACCPAARLAESVASALESAMAAAEPLADLRLSFACPGCAKPWETGLDPARFLWHELHSWAVRMLREVDALARAYHWCEADILAMDPRRRQAYLALAAP